MNELSLHGDKGELARVDVTNEDGWAGGDLSANGGNLYLYIDGRELGSLFISYDEHGRPSITLGQYDPETEGWEERVTIKHIPEARS